MDVSGAWGVEPPELVVLAVTTRLTMLAEQITSAPPPFADPLHWLIRTPPTARVPVALHRRPTSVPPFADPLHWVIAAPVVVAGNGSQFLVMPPPEPTHWLTVAACVVGFEPTKLFVTWTLHRSVPPPPLIESLHWLTRVTSRFISHVFVVHAAVGWPAAPWHSWTEVFDEPPVEVIVLTIVTRQIRPRPPELATPLLQVVVGAIVVLAAAAAGMNRDAPTSRAMPNTPKRMEGREERMTGTVGVERRMPMRFS